jgi:phage baseplate assembly protein V
MALHVLQRIETLERQIAQVNVRGKVSEVDYEKQLARVKYGENQTTGWLPWKPIRAGKAIVWWPLEVDEAVTVISPGDLTLGEIMPSSYSQAHSAPSTDKNLCIIQFGDGSEIRHDQSTGDYTATYKGSVIINADKDTTVNSKGKATIYSQDADVEVNAKGKVAINSDGKDISFNGGLGVVTGAHVCAFTGSAHSDFSTQVKAAK